MVFFNLQIVYLILPKLKFLKKIVIFCTNLLTKKNKYVRFALIEVTKMCLTADKYSNLMPNSYYLKKRMTDLGITQNYKGYYYLLDILNIIINEERVVRCFSREIYPALAEKYAIKGNTIERDIRNIINVCWDLKLKFKLKNFWTKDSRPTCCKFIFLVKNYVISDIA